MILQMPANREAEVQSLSSVCIHSHRSALSVPRKPMIMEVKFRLWWNVRWRSLYQESRVLPEMLHDIESIPLLFFSIPQKMPCNYYWSKWIHWFDWYQILSWFQANDSWTEKRYNDKRRKQMSQSCKQKPIICLVLKNRGSVKRRRFCIETA